jgi:Fe-S cluster biogenesis protein NfuA
MFIQTETTPNPDTLKFIPGQDVSPSQNYDFRSEESASSSPLATRIISLDGITGVFLGADFISISKQEQIDWVMLKPRIMSAIMDHYTSGEPVIQNNSEQADGESTNAHGQVNLDELSEDDKNIVTTIIELLDDLIRPAVAQDGGDIIFHRYEDGMVYLEMHGACSGCPSSTITLKAGIENMLQHYIPEVQEVRPVN